MPRNPLACVTVPGTTDSPSPQLAEHGVSSMSPNSTAPGPRATSKDYADQIVERHVLQKQSHINVLQSGMKNIPSFESGVKQVVDEATFDRVCRSAADNPRTTAETLATFAAEGGPPAYVEFAKLCFTGPVGLVGSRRALRAVGIMLLDKCIEKFPDYCPALCAKGEALLPPIHIGKADPDAPGPVLKEAFTLFSKAAALGSLEGRFLRGRWLITMAPVHRSGSRAAEGKADVKAAADANLPRALVFLAQCYEFPGRFSPVSFTRDLPSSRTEREKLILSLYMRAADLGDPDALNDVGSSYATAYAGLDHDFDMAARYYVKAIQAGSLHAFDNLGTHYETGMSGHFPDKVDLEKALHYYRHGAAMRCSKCSHNLGAAYEEGMHQILLCDPAKAEKYYRHTIYLADDENDAPTASRALKDLVALYVTRIKLNEPGGECVKKTTRRLQRYLKPRMLASTMADVNKAIAKAVRGQLKPLIDLLGDYNARLIQKLGTDILDRLNRQEDEPSEPDKNLIKHVFGAYTPETLRLSMRNPRAKRRRSKE